MRWHRCRWRETDRTYNPPPDRAIETDRIPPELMLRILYGFTVVSLTCDGCGDIKFITQVGATP